MYYVNENVNTPLLPVGGAFPIPLSSYIYGYTDNNNLPPLKT